MTNIGLCGAHRTGKTTLAIAFSTKTGIPFIPIDAGSVFKKHNLHPSKNMDLRTRISVQQEILEIAEKIWMGNSSIFITDRTPLDMAAYLLADIGNGEIDEHTQDEIMSYIGECFRVTKRYFNQLVLIPPAIPFIPSDYKAANNEPLIFSLHYTILGMLSALGVPYEKLPNDCLELGDRVSFVESFWRQK